MWWSCHPAIHLYSSYLPTNSKFPCSCYSLLSSPPHEMVLSFELRKMTLLWACIFLVFWCWLYTLWLKSPQNTQNTGCNSKYWFLKIKIIFSFFLFFSCCGKIYTIKFTILTILNEQFIGVLYIYFVMHSSPLSAEFFIFPDKNSIPIKQQSPVPFLPSHGNYHSTSCLPWISFL